jgi:hypothetical protein
MRWWEGSRPRDPLFAKSSARQVQDKNIHLTTWIILAARGDARPPVVGPSLAPHCFSGVAVGPGEAFAPARFNN